MYTEIPPDFFCIINAICFHQKFDKIFIRFNTFKIFRNACALEIYQILLCEKIYILYFALPKKENWY